MPRMCGIEWPYTSASRIPTCFPSCASATARFAASVDLPTPPLPLQTASTRVDASSERPFDRSCIPPRSFVVSACRSSAVITSKPSATRSTPGTSRSTSATCSLKESRSGHPATVRAIVTRTSPPSISMSRTMSSSVTGRRSSGSITRSSARRISSRFGSIPALSVAICGFVTWVSLVWRNLLRRPARTALTAAGVALGVGLIVALLSLSTGVKKTAEELIHVGRADFGLFQADVSDFSRSLLPESMAERVAAVPGVAQTAKLKLFASEGSFVFGLEPDEFVWRRLVLLEGHRPRGEEALAGDRSGHQLGDRLEVAPGRRFRIVGVYHSGDSFEDSGAVLSLRVVQRLAHRPREITTVAVAVRPGLRARTVAAQVERRFPGTVAVYEPGQAIKVDTSSRLIVDTGWIISLLALIVGGIGVTNTMAMSVFERVREIGILRAVGWRSWRIAVLIVSEAIGISLLALGVGLGLGVLAAEEFSNHTSTSGLVQPDFTAGVFAWGLAFALGVAVIGAAYPTWRAIRLAPIEALRRE